MGVHYLFFAGPQRNRKLISEYEVWISTSSKNILKFVQDKRKTDFALVPHHNGCRGVLKKARYVPKR